MGVVSESVLGVNIPKSIQGVYTFSFTNSRKDINTDLGFKHARMIGLPQKDVIHRNSQNGADGLPAALNLKPSPIYRTTRRKVCSTGPLFIIFGMFGNQSTRGIFNKPTYVSSNLLYCQNSVSHSNPLLFLNSEKNMKTCPFDFHLYFDLI